MGEPRRLAHWLSRRVFRLPATRDRALRSVDDELAFHLQGRIDELIARGMSPDDAAAEARRRFGNPDRFRAELRSIDQRSRRRARVGDMFEALAQDIRFAVRSLTRRPAFAATAIGVLALGIGATTAMYSVIDGVLIQPLPYRDPGRLVSIYTTFPEWKGQPILAAHWDRIRTPYPTYQRLLAGQQVFQDVAGFYVVDASLSLGSEAVSVTEGSASANLMSVLGVSPAQGRWFLPGEDGAGASRVAVLSYELWTSRFGGVPMLGRTVTLGEQPFTVIGIMPSGFALEGALVQHAEPSARADVWTPVGTDPSALDAGSNTLELMGRLRPGVSLATAEAATTPLLRGDLPPSKIGVRLISRREAETSDVQRPLLVLFGAVSILLFITCGNVATLFLSECAVRESELRTRSVLGAGRGRLIRLLLVESAVIAVAGTAAGSLLGWQGARLMLVLAPTDVPHASMIRFNARIWLFTIAVAVVVALIAGLAPALTLTRPGETNRSVSARVIAGRSRLQIVVLGLQSAMSVVLIAGALLLARSLANQHRVNPGFSAPNTLMLTIAPPQASAQSPPERRRLYALIFDALSAASGVEGVTAASTPPLSGRTNSIFTATNPTPGSASFSGSAERMVIMPNYFAALHVPVLAGRAFTRADIDGAVRVVIVSEGFARRFWPGESALAKQLRQPNGAVTVVGVVSDVRNRSFDRTPEAVFYLPLGQATARLSFLVRTRDDPLTAARTLERAAWDVVPGATISEVNSMDRLIARAMAPARYRAALATLFALLALLLTAVGVAGLAARSVTSRLPELCIRMALGATQERVRSLVIRSGMTATLAGILCGLLLAPFTSHWLADYLFQVETRDATSYVATSMITAAACVGVMLIATRRLRRADLAAVLRRA